MRNQEAWVVFDEDGQPCYAAGWESACHEHINDAISNHGLDCAAKWKVLRMVSPEPLVPELLAALKGVVAVADRKTAEFDRARAAIAKATGSASAPTEQSFLSKWRGVINETCNVSAPAAGSVPSDVDKKRIAHNAHVQCSLIPGATFYNAAEAAIDALLAQYGNPAWQPIETAPKDGTTILIGRDMGDFGFVRGYGRFEGTDGAYISGWVSSGFIDPPGNLGLAHPTHWMPLPPAPQEGK